MEKSYTNLLYSLQQNQIPIKQRQENTNKSTGGKYQQSNRIG